MGLPGAVRNVGREVVGQGGRLLAGGPPAATEEGRRRPDRPVGPDAYRLYEIPQVYGDAVKAVVHEEFGDGIMSAIDFEYRADRVESEDGDWVRITYEGRSGRTGNGDGGAAAPDGRPGWGFGCTLCLTHWRCSDTHQLIRQFLPGNN